MDSKEDFNLSQSNTQNNDGENTFSISINVNPQDVINQYEVQPLDGLIYSIKEKIKDENMHVITFNFGKTRVDIINIETNPEGIPNLRYSPPSNVSEWDFYYTNASFKLTIKVKILNSQKLEDENFTPHDHNAGMIDTMNEHRTIRIRDYSQLEPENQTFGIPDTFEQTDKLDSLITKINNQQKLKSCYFFCEICRPSKELDLIELVGKIYSSNMLIGQSKTFNFFNVDKITYREGKGKIAYIRCLIFIDRQEHPYVLAVCDDAKVNQIFEFVRNLISSCREIKARCTKVKFLRIKLCFKNHKIQLIENDKTSTLKKIAESVIYPFTNYYDSEDIFLKIKSILE